MYTVPIMFSCMTNDTFCCQSWNFQRVYGGQELQEPRRKRVIVPAQGYIGWRNSFLGIDSGPHTRLKIRAQNWLHVSNLHLHRSYDFQRNFVPNEFREKRQISVLHEIKWSFRGMAYFVVRNATKRNKMTQKVLSLRQNNVEIF